MDERRYEQSNFQFQMYKLEAWFLSLNYTSVVRNVYLYKFIYIYVVDDRRE